MKRLADDTAAKQHQVRGNWESQANFTMLPVQMVQLYIEREQYDGDVAR